MIQHNSNQIKKNVHKINKDISAEQVRLISSEGEALGILDLTEALNMAEEQELDLVEISPNATPPVCKIMNYGKFLYIQNKQQRIHKAKQKKFDLKTIRLSFKIEKHDQEIKMRQAYKFLEAGHKVKLDMRLRGREKAFMSSAFEKMNLIISNLPENIKIDQEMKQSPQGIIVTLAKKI